MPERGKSAADERNDSCDGCRGESSKNSVCRCAVEDLHWMRCEYEQGAYQAR